MRILVAAILALTGSVTAADIAIVHCPNGCPTGTPNTNTTVVREIYALSNNGTTKFADWVAYRVTSSTIGTSKDLNRSWQTDKLLNGDATLEKADYSCAARSSSSCTSQGFSSLDIDRGHQAPLAAFAGTVYWRDTNFLSNITPQKTALNAGSWMYLEGAVRAAAFKLHEVFVLTGPLYDPNENQMTLPKADETHMVPTGYWKVIYTKSGKMAAFVFDQDVDRDYNYCDAITTLSNVETQSGLDPVPTGCELA